MSTQVSIHHNDYSSEIRTIAEEKLGNLFRFCSDKVSLKAHLERQAGGHRVEIVASVPHGPVLVSDVHAEGVMHALDEALSRMTRQLKRSRDKRTVERRRPSRTGE
ncbi:MAG: ribosomal subunit interface protein [Planctomycetota bacterium]|jgi:ribosomal subunit interface protein